MGVLFWFLRGPPLGSVVQYLTPLVVQSSSLHVPPTLSRPFARSVNYSLVQIPKKGKCSKKNFQPPPRPPPSRVLSPRYIPFTHPTAQISPRTSFCSPFVSLFYSSFRLSACSFRVPIPSKYNGNYQHTVVADNINRQSFNVPPKAPLWEVPPQQGQKSSDNVAAAY